MLNRRFPFTALCLSFIIACTCLVNHSLASTQATPKQEAKLHIAVASNFRATLDKLAPLYSKNHRQELVISAAATGVLYQQIRHGAKFDVFLSADSKRPKLLMADGLALNETLYAKGKLVLATKNGNSLPSLGDLAAAKTFLSQQAKRSVAIAKPNTAPYGLAAKQVYQRFGLWQASKKSRIETGNIAQAALLLDQGHVQYAFLAQAIAQQMPDIKSIEIPSTFYKSINQSAVVLSASNNKQAATELFKFLQSDAAQNIITNSGYHAL